MCEVSEGGCYDYGPARVTSNFAGLERKTIEGGYENCCASCYEKPNCIQYERDPVSNSCTIFLYGVPQVNDPSSCCSPDIVPSLTTEDLTAGEATVVGRGPCQATV